MIDVTTLNERERDVREELDGVLETMRDSGEGKIAVVFNKIDRQDVELDEVMGKLDLEDGIEDGLQLRGFKTAAINGDGLEDLFTWLGSQGENR